MFCFACSRVWANAFFSRSNLPIFLSKSSSIFTKSARCATQDVTSSANQITHTA